MTINKYLIRADYATGQVFSPADFQAAKDTAVSILRSMFPEDRVTAADLITSESVSPKEFQIEILLTNSNEYYMGECEKLVRALIGIDGLFILRAEALRFYDPPTLAGQPPASGWLVDGSAVWYRSEGITVETALPMKFATTHTVYADVVGISLLEATRLTHRLIYGGIELFKNDCGRLLRVYRYGERNEIVFSKK